MQYVSTFDSASGYERLALLTRITFKSQGSFANGKVGNICALSWLLPVSKYITLKRIDLIAFKKYPMLMLRTKNLFVVIKYNEVNILQVFFSFSRLC